MGWKYTRSPLLCPTSLLLPSENTLKATTFTIFCHPDKAFFTPMYPQPPLSTLIQYPIVPSNLDRESLESPLWYKSKIDTLLPGHPVVLTTAPHDGHASINGIKVTDWDMYDNGHAIVHGVEDFFDLTFQTLLYPWYDKNNHSNKNGIDKSGVDEAVSSGSGSATSWEKDMMADKLFIMLAGVSLAGWILTLVCFYYWANRRYSEYSFISTEV